MSWFDGGDVNKSIQGWRGYFQDHNNNPYSLSYDLKELHGFWGSGAEVSIQLSSQINIALGFEYLTKSSFGVISSDLNQEQSYSNSSDDFGTFTVDEHTLQNPKYLIRSFPITLTLYYSFPFKANLNFYFGGGLGFYFGRLLYEEEYSYTFDYTDENYISNSLVEYYDQYSASGTYSEKSQSKALGPHLCGGIQFKVSDGVHFVVEAFSRWVDFDSWKGNKSDQYAWEHTWGYWGAYSDNGSVNEINQGKLWIGEFQSNENGKSYSRLVFSEEKPHSLYLNPRPAKINLNGFSLKIGIKLSL